MAIPDFQTLMLPVLRVCGDQNEHRFSDIVRVLASQYHLTDEELQQLLPSGRYPVFKNRVAWARTYLVKSGLLESPRREFVKVTDKGRKVLGKAPVKITIGYLKQFPEFVEFQERSTDQKPVTSDQKSVTTRKLIQAIEPEEEKTPEENIDFSYLQLRSELAKDILDRVKSCSPAFFEKMVVEVLVAMGYGGSLSDAGQTVGKSGDGGIDGIIKEDRLGLDVIYIQAKRWDSTVGRPEIQKFVGALQGQRARKGVFITTSNYTKDSIEYARNIDCKVVLIDGMQLSNLMIDLNVGVSCAVKYEIKKIDSDYFIED